MLGLLWFLQRRLSRRGASRGIRPRPDEAITVLGRQGLGSKAHLVVVQVEQARYVLAVTEHRVDVVDRLPARDAADRTQAPDAATEALAVDRPGEGSEDFARVLTAVSRPAPLEQPFALRAHRRQDPLRGSILSAQTWRQTAEAIRRAR